MKKFIKLSIVASFLAFGAFFAFSNAAQASLVPMSGELNADAISPRSLYASNCAGCHGSNGKGQTARGRKLEADDISGGTSTSKTIRVVTNGKGKMPSFKRRLTSAQIAQIAGYVSTL